MIYDFNNLNEKQKQIYINFKMNIASDKSPLNTSNNEDNLRNIFENELNKLLRDLEFLNTGYELFQHESNNEKGRTDFQYGNTIIEYKKYGLLNKKLETNKQIEKEKEQIKGYLKDKKFNGIKIYGFLFDGIYIYSYTKQENEEIIDNSEYSGKITEKIMDNFIKTIFVSGIVAISPTNLKNDFGIIDANNNKLINNVDVRDLAKYLFKVLKNTDSINTRTSLLYNEWEKLFRLAENDKGKHLDIKERREVFSKLFDELINDEVEYKALFALHTTLSIIIKLLLARIVNDIPSFENNIDLDRLYKTDSLKEVQSFFINVENGNFFKSTGITNLTDNDFFAWYVKENITLDLVKILQKLIYKMCSYENIYITKSTTMIDMFKELYLNFIPKVVRHSFGEYYTPYWLSERTLLLAIGKEKNLQNKSFIDPNCGSGTFLSVFFNYKHKFLKKKIDFKKYCDGIVGVDINPIAVLMARANILIAGLKQCSFSQNEKYEIPVYLADSLYVPKIIIIDNVECFDYELYTSSLSNTFGKDSIRLVMPKNLVYKTNFMEIIIEIEQYIIKLKEKEAFAVFEREVPEIKNGKNITKLMKNNIKELIEFERKNLNSIWLKIFSNYFKVASYDKFDYIVGNPAWINWGVLPEIYRNNIKKHMRMDGLFSTDKNVGGNNLNICALISNKCCERWLDDKGAFAFLMPKSILFNKSFEGFRNLCINNNEKMYFSEFIDFSNGGEIFEGVGLDFCAFKIIKTPPNDTNIVPLIDYTKDTKFPKPNHNNIWEEAKQSFKETQKYAIALNTNINNNYLITECKDKAKCLLSLIGQFEYQFRKGVSVPYHMRLKFVEMSHKKGIALFNPYVKVGNRIKVDENKTIELELEYILPYITAPMLTNDGIVWKNSYVICPYFKGKRQPIPKATLKTISPYIYKYLDSLSDILGNGSNFNSRVQTLNEQYGILRIGSYTWGNVFVCIRDNTKLAPNLISRIRSHWDTDLLPLFDNHISYISEVVLNKEKRFIDLNEAQYILNKLKDKNVNEIILNSQDGRSISSRLPIKLKIFNQKNLF